MAAFPKCSMSYVLLICSRGADKSRRSRMREIARWIGGVMQKVLPQDAGAAGTGGDEMEKAQRLWREIFRGEPPWVDAVTSTMNLGGAIAGEMARLVTVELKSKLGGGARGDFLDGAYATVLGKLRGEVEFAVAEGGVVMKPFVQDGRMYVDFVHAGAFCPTAVAPDGEITAAVFTQRAEEGGREYLRLEKHELLADGYHVRNEAYRRVAPGGKLVAVPLERVAQWRGLAPEVVIRTAGSGAIAHPLFAYFRMPFANHVDAASPLGVAVYSRASDLLREADRQYSRILWEYEGSELAIDASYGALKPMGARRDGDRAPTLAMPQRQRRLFRELAIDKGDGGDLYQVFSPAIRDESLFNGLERLLKRIEFACYLSYGTLSDPQSVEKTAEEIKMSKQRSYSAVCDIQKALEGALRRLVWAMDVYASLYRLAPEGRYSQSFSWGDAVSTDTEREREAFRQDCRDGAAAWWEYRVKFYGESEEEAKRRIEQLNVGTRAE